MDLNLSPGAVFHAEFDSGSKIGPEPAQKPILTNFRKITFFIKIQIFNVPKASSGKDKD